MRELYARLTPDDRRTYFSGNSTSEKPKLKSKTPKCVRLALQKKVFDSLSYDEKLVWCDRPEQIDGPSEEAWREINRHLKTSASNLPELIKELGERRFGHLPRVGDAFCGGGSVPFEAARMGCEAYASDLNPVAALLTWAALNIVGGGEDVAAKVRAAQNRVYEAVNRQILEWGIEQNEFGHRADAYLYCNETRCPECGWMVPLAPSWVIGEKTKCVAKLKPDAENRCFEILIESGVSEAEMAEAKAAGTVKDSSLICPAPKCEKSTPFTMLRGDRRSSEGSEYGLRLWENDDLVPRPGDVFQERLYCIRWVEKYRDEEGREQVYRYYLAPAERDLAIEEKVLDLLRERFHDWQEKGYIPLRRIEPGYNTDQPIRERGWTHWHHLFNPRQLLAGGLINEKIAIINSETPNQISCLLGLQRSVDHNSRLSGWSASIGKEIVDHVFANQALNTLNNFGTRGIGAIETAFILNLKPYNTLQLSIVQPTDGRNLTTECDIWITDPPYADAINYHELSDFFLSWIEAAVQRIFPSWYTDSKRALAITGSDDGFRKSMVDCYRNLAEHMPEDGQQIVMFTHQDASVWADLALILWASGLRVTSAWCIATETDSALKEGNYVQGTVLLVLRKQTSDETAFLDEIYPKVEEEVKSQLEAMIALDDREDPNFGDTDYQLAAYAAALRVLTQYRNIEDIDVAYELSRPKRRDEESPIERVIADAVRIACDFLVPKGFDKFVWKTLIPEERFYLKGLEIESHGEFRAGAYQELARGFGVREYRPMLSNDKANQTRLRTAGEFAARLLNNDAGFGPSLVRHALFAIHQMMRQEGAQAGKNWLRNEVPNYWNQRKNLIEILNYLSRLGHTIPHWREESDAAKILAGAVENDSI